MNYFIANLFNDWKYWAGLAFIFIAVLDVLDVLSVSFAAPGFFNLWMVKITGAAALIGLGHGGHQIPEINGDLLGFV